MIGRVGAAQASSSLFIKQRGISILRTSHNWPYPKVGEYRGDGHASRGSRASPGLTCDRDTGGLRSVRVGRYNPGEPGGTEGKEVTDAYGHDARGASRLRTPERAAGAKRDLGAARRALLRGTELNTKATHRATVPRGLSGAASARRFACYAKLLPRGWLLRASATAPKGGWGYPVFDDDRGGSPVTRRHRT